MPYRFLSAHRLKNSLEIRNLFKFGARIKSKCIVAYFKKNGRENPRLAIVIAKRNVPLAVLRNRIKRIARETFRLHQYQLACNDIVLVCQKGIADETNQEIATCLDNLWGELSE